MDIQYASDLHLEFPDNTEYLAAHPLEVKGDILVLAGDTIVLMDDEWKKHPFFDWCAANYRETFLLPGNHEYYGGEEVNNRFWNYEYFVRENVRYINNKSVRIDDTELFFTTLWTKVPEKNLVAVELCMNDCRLIQLAGGIFNALDYSKLHKRCVVWLAQAMLTSDAKHKIVVTHHQPTLRYSNPERNLGPVGSAYMVDMDSFICRFRPEYWIHGHTHYNGGSGTVIGKTTLLCNQMGYVKYKQNGTFSHDAHIHIE